MVVYQLTDVEWRISEVLVQSQGAWTSSAMASFLDFLRNEERRIALAFKEECLSHDNEQRLHRYFQAHQRGLTKVLDLLFEAEHATVKNSIAKFFNDGGKVLLALLALIENEHSQFFDITQNLPKYLIDKFRKTIDGQTAMMNEKLKSADVEVKKLLEDFAAQIFEAHEVPFCRIYSFENFVRELLTIDLSDLSCEDQNEVLFKLLVTTNFNAESVIAFYANEMKCILAPLETLSDQIVAASFQVKRIQRISTLPNVAWNYAAPRIKDQLLEWLTCELDYLRGKIELGGFDKSNSVAKDYKLKLNASVSQLSYVVRILLDNGIIETQNTSELIRFVTKFVSTKKSETISFDSFRLKFYNPEIGTKDAVKTILQRLHSYIVKN